MRKFLTKKTKNVAVGAAVHGAELSNSPQMIFKQLKVSRVNLVARLRQITPIWPELEQR